MKVTRSKDSRQTNSMVSNITAKKGKYNEVTLEFNPPYTEGKVPDFSYPRGRCTLIGTLYAIGVLDTPIDCWSNSSKNTCESLFDANKDKLFNNIRVPLDRYVNLFDYQLGPYTSSELLGQSMQSGFSDALQNKGYNGINSLNSPDMYLFRFLCDIVQHQMVDLKIAYDKDGRYGVGKVSFEFSIADFNFELVTTGDFSGLYNHIGVNELIDAWGMTDLLRSLGYKRGSNISGYPKNYLRMFTRTGNSRRVNSDLRGVHGEVKSAYDYLKSHLRNPKDLDCVVDWESDRERGYWCYLILIPKPISDEESKEVIKKVASFPDIIDASDYYAGRYPKHIVLASSDMCEWERPLVDEIRNSRQSNSVLPQADIKVADVYVAKANNDNYLDILKEIAKELGEHFDVRKEFETPNEFRAWAEENDKISDRMYIVIDYVLGAVTGMKKGVRQSNDRLTNSNVDHLLKLGGFALKVCKEIFGEDNCLMITRIIEDDGQVDIDLGRGVRSFKPSPNSDAFYELSRSESDEYYRNRVARIMICEGSYEIEGNKGNYFKEFGSNDYVIIPSLKKHLREYVSL